MKFADVIRSQQHLPSITPRHEQWMAKGDPVYKDWVVEWAAKQLRSTGRVRRHSFSASSLGGCKRAQQLTWIGLPGRGFGSQTMSIFGNGTFMHLRWQMEGLSEGWLDKAEEPVPENPLRLSGTMDGICHDGAIAEFKSINAYGFSSVLSFGPKTMHLFQGAAYALCSGRERVSFLYENKDTQEYKEIVKHRDELPLDEVVTKARELWSKTEARELFGPMDNVYEGKGECRSCPFRADCLEIRTFEEAEELADVA